MAKRRNQGGGGGLLIIAGLAIALVFLSYLAMVSILLWWMATEIYLFKTKRLSRMHFGLSQEESDELLQLQRELNAQIDKSKAIMAKGADLSVRQDGFFQERSDLGKTLNRQLAPSVNLGKELEQAVRRLEERPTRRLGKWMGRRARRLALRASVAVMGTSFLTLATAKPIWAIESAEILVQISQALIPVPTPSAEQLAVVAPSAFLSLLTYFTGKSIFLWRLKNNNGLARSIMVSSSN